MDKGSRAGQVAVFQKSSFIMSFKDAIIFLTLLAVAFLLGLSATLYEFVPMQGWKKIPVPKQKGRKKLLFIPEGWRKKVEFKHIKCKSWAGIIKRHRRRSNQQGSNVGKKNTKTIKTFGEKGCLFWVQLNVHINSKEEEKNAQLMRHTSAKTPPPSPVVKHIHFLTPKRQNITAELFGKIIINMPPSPQGAFVVLQLFGGYFALYDSATHIFQRPPHKHRNDSVLQVATVIGVAVLSTQHVHTKKKVATFFCCKL